MTKTELAELMDEVHGAGAGERWLANMAAEEEAVLVLGERIGYGRMMQLAEKLWRAKLAATYPGTEGGEHSALAITGPCAGFLVPCPCRQTPGCGWCCGAGRVTKRVAEAYKELGQ